MKKITGTVVTFLFSLIVGLFVITTCKNPMTPELFNQSVDKTGPKITLTAPSNGDVYGGLTTISGTVTDLSGEAAGRVTSLTVEVVGLTSPITIDVGEDGSFSYVLSTQGTGFDRDIILKLAAVDWNGNTGEISAALVKGAGAIPSFSAAAGNGEVALSWDPVPGATGYAVYYVRSISLPDRSYPTVTQIDLGSGETGCTIGEIAYGSVQKELTDYGRIGVLIGNFKRGSSTSIYGSQHTTESYVASRKISS